MQEEPGLSEMGPGVHGSWRQRTSSGPRGVPGRAGLWWPASRPGGSPGGGRSSAVQGQTPAAPQPREDLRRRLGRALQRAVARGGSRRAREAAAAAREERGRARVESALGRLRAELLEMHFQNHQLARTLLDLNMKMQQLKKEHELEIALESQSPEDDAVNLELGNAHLKI